MQEEIADCRRELTKDVAVVVEQHLEFELGLADYAYVLDRGRVALDGRASAVRKDPRLVQFLARDHADGGFCLLSLRLAHR